MEKILHIEVLTLSGVHETPEVFTNAEKGAQIAV
jgi:hypothetical protein